MDRFVKKGGGSDRFRSDRARTATRTGPLLPGPFVGGARERAGDDAGGEEVAPT